MKKLIEVALPLDAINIEAGETGDFSLSLPRTDS